MAIGEKLSALLKVKGKKPGTLATETGVSKSTIYSIIKRNNEKVSYSVIEAIADNLGVPVEYFFEQQGGALNEASQIQTMTNSEARLLNVYRRLSDDKQTMLLVTAEAWLASEEEEKKIAEINVS